MISLKTVRVLRKVLSITRYNILTILIILYNIMQSSTAPTQNHHKPLHLQVYLEYTADAYCKFMQGADTFEEEDEAFLNKLSEHIIFL